LVVIHPELHLNLINVLLWMIEEPLKLLCLLPYRYCACIRHFLRFGNRPVGPMREAPSRGKMEIAVTEKEGWTNPRLAGRIAELDGVRGLAILLVLIWHYFEIVPAQSILLFRIIHMAFSLSWSGVDLFFVLSGFLIGGILYDARESENYFRTFYLRRVHRIFPVYFLWIALFFVGLFFASPSRSGALRDIFNSDVPVWSYPLFIQNLLMAKRQILGCAWLGITWSLAVEEQFYLLLPMAVRHFRIRTLVALVALSILAAPVIRIFFAHAGNIYYAPYVLLPCRADALGSGVLIAIAVRQERVWRMLESHRHYLYLTFGILACGFAYLAVKQNRLYTFGLTWIAAFYGVLLLLVLVRPGKLERAIFRTPILTGLGTIAYAVYLFHQGTNYLLHLAFLKSPPALSGWPSLLVTLLSLAIVVPLAVISWVFFEKPLVTRAKKYKY
jgi:peptidoglycan/LPS O-acetylase OafA/YrhL